MSARHSHAKRCRQTPGAVLAAAIEALSAGLARVTITRERPWASITFSGTRHSIMVSWRNDVNCAGKKEFMKILPDHEFAIPGHFVADLLITEQTESQLLIEVLTIIDPVDSLRK